jgi:Tfp pilus assembly protein PilF
MLDQKGEFQKAQGLYQRALQHRPGYSDAHLNFAISLEKAGFLDKAKREYEHFLSSASPEQSGLVEKIKAHLRQL